MPDATTNGKPKNRYKERGTHAFTCDLLPADYDALESLAKADNRKFTAYVRLVLLKHIAESKETKHSSPANV